MGRYYHYCTVLSVFIMIGFLWSTNKNIHHDFQIIKKEVKTTNDHLHKLEISKQFQLEHSTKKKKSDRNIFLNYIDSRDKARLMLETKGSIPAGVFNYDLRKLFRNSNPYFKTAIESEDKILANAYLNMALSIRLDGLIDSLQSKRQIPYYSELITLNEPATYHLNQVYPIYFDIINKVVNHDEINIKHKGEFINSESFPFVFDEAQAQKIFEVYLNEYKSPYYLNHLQTRNHTIQP